LPYRMSAHAPVARQVAGSVRPEGLADLGATDFDDLRR
jgi:hypothetical protein